MALTPLTPYLTPQRRTTGGSRSPQRGRRADGGVAPRRQRVAVRTRLRTDSEDHAGDRAVDRTTSALPAVAPVVHHHRSAARRRHGLLKMLDVVVETTHDQRLTEARRTAGL